MAYIRRVLQPIRASISVLSSTNSSFRSCTTRNLLLNGNYKHLNTWVKGIEPVSQGRASRFYDKLNIQKNGGIRNLDFSSGKSYGGAFRRWMLVTYIFTSIFLWSSVGLITSSSLVCSTDCYNVYNISVRKIGVGSIIGMSVITGVLSLRSQDAYAMNGTDVLEEAHNSNLWDSLDPEDDQYAFVAFVKKIWMPALLVITMVMSWDHPFTTIALKVFLYLLSTKPSALSVYVFVEKIRRQCIRQDHSYIRKSSYYAKRVDVEDYVLLQLATVEFGDREITLIGILGSWWVVNCTPCHKILVM